MSVIRLYRHLENWWFAKIPQKLRFLLVGGFNTVFAYVVFALLYLWLGRHALALTLQYAISINVSTILMRYYVFRGGASFWAEYARAVFVYLWMLALNQAFLYLVVDRLKTGALVAQAVYLIISTIVIYLLHKYFSFRNLKVRE
jgi:putative flippase GtrA